MKEEKWTLNSAHAMHWCLKNQSNQTRYMFCKIYLNFMEQYSFKVDRNNIGFELMTSHYWYLHIQSLIAVIWTITLHAKNLMFYLMQPLDVQIRVLSIRLQWTEKWRPMDVQWTCNMVHGRTDLIRHLMDIPRTSDAHWVWNEGIQNHLFHIFVSIKKFSYNKNI